MVFSSINH